jgi:hypothetical protein
MPYRRELWRIISSSEVRFMCNITTETKEMVATETTEAAVAEMTETTEKVAAETMETVAAEMTEYAHRQHGTVSEVSLDDAELYQRGHQPVSSISETRIMWNITPSPVSDPFYLMYPSMIPPFVLLKCMAIALSFSSHLTCDSSILSAADLMSSWM